MASRTWSKRILPVGSIDYQGRTLHFTPGYLRGLVDAFRANAYDQVPLQLADSDNRHTNDPERTAGEITDLELREDGLYALATVTERGERVLTENPRLGVSARIVEQYARADGKFFPAAVQHVLATLDPRVPGLGAWQPIDMSNGGEIVIDLSGSSFPGDRLSPQEQAELEAAVAEADAELDDAELAALIRAAEQEDAMSEFGAAFDGHYAERHAAEQARQEARQAADLEDLIRPARTDEQILARAIGRIGQGIYTDETALSFANDDRATEVTMATGHGLCGPADPYGRCSSRFHNLECVAGVSTDWLAAGAPRATYQAALSSAMGLANPAPGASARWVDDGSGEQGYAIPARTVELASRLADTWGLRGDTGDWTPGWDDLFGAPETSPDGQLYPDVTAMRRGMGI